MVLFCNLLAGRNAVNDAYKSILLSLDFEKQKKIVATIPEGYTLDEFEGNINLFVYGKQKGLFSGMGKIARFLNVVRHIKNNNIKTIIFFYDNTLLHTLLAIVGYIYNIRLVVWVHDPILHDGERIHKKIIRFLNKYIVFKKADKIIVSYNGAKLIMHQKYGIKWHKLKTIFLPRMRELEFKDIRAGNYEKKFDFIFFGRLEEYKGIDLFIDFVSRNQQFSFCIIGKGSYEKYIPHNDNVFFINGYIDGRELAKCIMQSRCLILPYKTATGTQTIQIANYYGIPVLATNEGCFPEYIQEGVNGYIIKYHTVDSVNQCAEILFNSQLDSKAIKRYFENTFSCTKTIKELFGVL